MTTFEMESLPVEPHPDPTLDGYVVARWRPNPRKPPMPSSWVRDFHKGPRGVTPYFTASGIGSDKPYFENGILEWTMPADRIEFARQWVAGAAGFANLPKS
jgi:hypothetical protein